MIKRELEKDPALKNEDWDRFMPQVRREERNSYIREREIHLI